MTREELLQTAKPILFNTDMVRAILDGRKSTTRRVIKPQPTHNQIYKLGYCICGDRKDIGKFGFGTNPYGGEITYAKPPYKVGDILYVRETFLPFKNTVYYKADKKHEELEALGIKFKWRPSIHMPKEAARIFLRVTDVRVERLQDITLDQLEKEGFEVCYTHEKSTLPSVDRIVSQLISETAANKFISVWDSTVKKKDLELYGWDANPWVWVIELERIEVE